jgi:hypothetical protein
MGHQQDPPGAGARLDARTIIKDLDAQPLSRRPFQGLSVPEREKPTAMRRAKRRNILQSLNHERSTPVIRKLKSGGYRLYSREINPKTGRRRNLGTFKTRAVAEKHERAVQFFKRH